MHELCFGDRLSEPDSFVKPPWDDLLVLRLTLFGVWGQDCCTLCCFPVPALKKDTRTSKDHGLQDPCVYVVFAAPIYLSTYLSFYLFIHPSIYLFIHLEVHAQVYKLPHYPTSGLLDLGCRILGTHTEPVFWHISQRRLASTKDNRDPTSGLY